jgi:hypothetical protein
MEKEALLKMADPLYWRDCISNLMAENIFM